jgi:hypothetical protein
MRLIGELKRKRAAMVDKETMVSDKDLDKSDSTVQRMISDCSDDSRTVGGSV